MNEVKNHLYKEELPNIKYFSEKSLINVEKLLNLEKKSNQDVSYEEIIRETEGEEVSIGDTDQYTSTMTSTKLVEFKVDDLINKTLEYSYTLDAINKGGIPE